MNQLAALLRNSDQPAPKPSPLAALLDPQFRADVGANAKSFLQGLNNGIASNINGPVDLLALLSRKIGLPTPDKPVLGSEWMRHYGLIAEPTDKLTGMFGDVAGNVLPFALMTKAPQIARGLLNFDEALQPTVARMADKYMDKTGMRLGAAPAYQIEHKPMQITGGASPLHDLGSSFGSDIYGKNALQYFGSGDPREKQVLDILNKVRGNPNAEVTIYRGVPKGVSGINPGDWVTLHPNVAAYYGNVISQKVPASHITSWPDSLLEFGYHPPEGLLK